MLLPGRELHGLLKAWDAMRLGKDAQIAALMERSKRHEEEKEEQARTVESLRRKIAVAAQAAGAFAFQQQALRDTSRDQLLTLPER